MKRRVKFEIFYIKSIEVIYTHTHIFNELDGSLKKNH